MACGTVTLKGAKNIAKYVEAGALVRTYPCSRAMKSGNYRNLGAAFNAGAQMICINLQGLCPDDSTVCTGASKSLMVFQHRRRRNCKCQRDMAAELETRFEEHGYDGYLHWNSLSKSAQDDFLK